MANDVLTREGPTVGGVVAVRCRSKARPLRHMRAFASTLTVFEGKAELSFGQQQGQDTYRRVGVRRLNTACDKGAFHKEGNKQFLDIPRHVTR